MTPYFTQHTPPALVATLPPMVDHGALAGSGGYHSPFSAQASRKVWLTTPGCTTASCSCGLISTRASIASNDTMTHPSVALAPPDNPVPAPRATSGTPASMQKRTSDCTSPAERARTTASDRPKGAHAA